MPDTGIAPLAESLGSFSSVVFFIFLGAALLIIWQVLIMVGALIASFWRRDPQEEGGQVEVG
jgi:hypothetical protein